MICAICNKNFAECRCPDAEERLKDLLESGFIAISPEYLKRIEDNIARRKQERANEQTRAE